MSTKASLTIKLEREREREGHVKLFRIGSVSNGLKASLTFITLAYYIPHVANFMGYIREWVSYCVDMIPEIGNPRKIAPWPLNFSLKGKCRDNDLAVCFVRRNCRRCIKD